MSPAAPKVHQDSELRGVAARGFVFTATETVINRALSLISFVVLARLLTPRQYGLAALANVFIGLFSILAASGYSQALVQRPTVDKKDLDTMFWVGLITGLVLAAIMFVAAGPIASAYGAPQLRPVLQVLSLNFIFIPIGSVHQAVMQRRLAWRGLAIRTVVANVLATTVGVIFAFAGFGIWALVSQTAIACAAGAIALVLQSGYTPSLYLSKTRFLSMFEFSRNYLGNSFLLFLNQRTDDFLIGSVLGATQLGIYTIAYRILTIMIDVLSTTVRLVAFPLFSQIQHDRARLLRAYRSANRMCSAVAMPTFFLSLVLAPELVYAFFGTKWSASVPVMRILCLFGALEGVATFNNVVLSSMGRMSLVFRIGVLDTGVQIIAFVVTVRYGIEWVAAGYVIRAYLLAPIGFIVAARELNTTARHTLSGFVPSIICTAAMCGVVIAAKALLGNFADEYVRLLAFLILGTLTYTVSLRFVHRALFDEVLGYFRRAVGGVPWREAVPEPQSAAEAGGTSVSAPSALADPEAQSEKLRT